MLIPYTNYRKKLKVFSLAHLLSLKTTANRAY